MVKYKILNKVSIICCIIGLIVSSLGLFLGLSSIGGEGWEALGTLLIIPSIISIIVILVDLLITLNKIKKGLLYSTISCIFKVCIISNVFPSAIDDIKYQLEYGVSNMSIYIILITFLVIITLPSIINIIKLRDINKV